MKDRYKLFGMQINIHDEVNVYRRVTYDVLNWLANIGGLQKWFMLVGTWFVARFASVQMAALIANRIYTWTPPRSF